ncbi:SH3 domain-containing protein [Streptomyces niveiscabiei]|uniref:SH3 domain-containing protein n=1 Tax=Streptomyces TaxID=1883 RepID=UPI001F0BC013|nr:SH3 domain-containing protein [Streptomyces sp. V2]
MRTLGRIAATTLSAAALFGGLMVTAPVASALPAQCAKDDTFPVPLAKTVTSNVNLRKAPGTGSASLGILTKGTKYTAHCLAYKGGTNWYYGKVTSGANKGTWGWAAWDYFRD